MSGRTPPFAALDGGQMIVSVLDGGAPPGVRVLLHKLWWEEGRVCFKPDGERVVDASRLQPPTIGLFRSRGLYVPPVPGREAQYTPPRKMSTL